MSDHLLVEICTGSLDDALAAQAGGADRVELNSNLLQGGLTPTLGTLIEAKRRLSIPVMCMIRPRGGGFCYSEPELAVMERDAELAVAHGADGIVFGFLRENGEIDLQRAKSFMARAGDRQTVFHRAFDVTPDPFVALEQLIDLGVTRILTSGQEETVYNGCETIRRLIEQADGRIEILPGGGIDLFNLRDVLERTGTKQVHLALFTQYRDNSTLARPHVFFGGSLRPPEDVIDVIDSSAVAGIRKIL
ncbi:MAG: copper homeostasis protein CutC [Armatimonadota bacterium]